MTSFYREGKRAGQSGSSALDCPYKSGLARAHWFAGFSAGLSLFRAGRVVGNGLEFRAATGRRAGRGVSAKI